MNADFDAKRRRAASIVNDKNLWVSSTQRAIFESLWSMGIPVRPPQFYNPVGLGLVVSLMFGAAVSSDEWIFSFTQPQTHSIGGAITKFVAATIFASLFLIPILVHRRKKQKLPSWQSLVGIYPSNDPSKRTRQHVPRNTSDT